MLIEKFFSYWEVVSLERVKKRFNQMSDNDEVGMSFEFYMLFNSSFRWHIEVCVRVVDDVWVYVRPSIKKDLVKNVEILCY